MITSHKNLSGFLIACGLGVVCWSIGMVAFGQDSATVSKAAVPIKIDIAMFIGSAGVTEQSVPDPVWVFSPSSNRQLIQVPVIVKPGPELIELQSDLSLRGGRFLAWYIEPLDSFEELEEGEEPSEKPQDDSSVPAGAPRVAKRITISPDGKVKWSLDRSIRGAKVTGSQDQTRPTARTRRTRTPGRRFSRRSGGGSFGGIPDPFGGAFGRTPGRRRRANTFSDSTNIIDGEGEDFGENLYPLKLDAALLKQRNPGRSPRIRREEGEDASTYRERQRKQRKAINKAKSTYSELRKKLRDIPTEFEQAMPKHLWAIFDAPGSLTEISIRGIEPEDWSLSMRDFQALRQMTNEQSNRNREGPLDGEILQVIRQLSSIVKPDQHVLTLRAVSHGLAMSGLIGKLEPSGPLYDLVLGLSTSQDPEARRAILEEVAAITPPNRTTLSLLSQSLNDKDPLVQLESFRGVLRASIIDGRQMAKSLSAANRLISNESISPDLVLDALLDVAAEDPDRTSALLSRGVRFDSVEGDRLDGVIRFVINHAPEDPVAAAWLDQRLLGSPKTLLRTLEILSAAQTGPSVLEPMIQRMLDAWLGPAEAPPQSAQSVLALSRPILILSSSHNLFGVLQSGDTKVRQLAWRQLRHFTFEEEGQFGISETNETDAFGVLVDAALSRRETPSQAAEFLVRQSDQERSTFALTRLAANASPRTAALAGRYLIHSGRPIANAIQHLPFEERSSFAEAMYRASREDPPLVTAMMSHPENHEMVQWFGDEISNGTRPPIRAKWAEKFDESKLMDILAGTKKKDVAMGAIDALVASAGGEEDQTVTITEVLFGEELSRDELLEKWRDHRRNVYVARLSAMAGTFRLIMHLYKATGEGGGRRPGGFGGAPDPFGGLAGFGGQSPFSVRGQDGTRPAPEKTLELGTVELQVNDGEISFGSTAITLSVPERFSIQLPLPADLENLPVPELGELSLGELDQVLNLLPEKGGVFRGGLVLPDGRPFELVMQPDAS